MKLRGYTKDFISGEYEAYKNRAQRYISSGDYNTAIKCIFFSARIAYHAPIRHDFVDDGLEQLLVAISGNFLPLPPAFKANTEQTNKVIFYNTYIADSGQLTEQFLNYFIENKIEVLFILPNKEAALFGQRILKVLRETPTVELYIPDGGDYVEHIKQIHSKILDSGITKAFLQFKPDDVIGFSVFAHLKNVRRYFIDLANQHFWIGKACSDMFIEIFKIGYLQALERRQIERNRIFYLPIYPVIDKVEFKGFPFDRKGKIVGVSGGLLYKYLSDPELKYFKVIKDLLNENPNFVFCLAGDGMPTTRIENFIRENKLENKFYIVGKREDFYEFVKKSDILFESYPVKGGLVPLYAVAAKVPLIGLSNVFAGIEDLLDIENYKQPATFEEFYTEAKMLISSAEERSKNVAIFQQCKKTKYYFDKVMSEIVAGSKLPDKEMFMNDHLVYDDSQALKEHLSLPDIEFNYYLEKIVFTRDVLSLAEQAKTAIKLVTTIRHISTLLILYRYFRYAIKIIKNNILNLLNK